MNKNLKKYGSILSLQIILSVNFLILPIANAESSEQTINQKLMALEISTHGRLGISATDTTTGMKIQHHAQERFPMCSTVKLMVAAAILKQSMTNHDLLQKKIYYKKTDISAYSPITKNHIYDGMTVAELCAAAIQYSDNTAFKLLVKLLGGVNVVNDFAKYIGDKSFRLDRGEPELNTALPNDPRDTTTPESMEITLQKLVLGNALGLPQQAQLQTWLLGNTTGNYRMRAALPKDWIVGDKTGTGDYGVTNDIGVIWPKSCEPVTATVYFRENQQKAKKRDDVIAEATKLLMAEFAKYNTCIKYNF